MKENHKFKGLSIVLLAFFFMSYLGALPLITEEISMDTKDELTNNPESQAGGVIGYYDFNNEDDTMSTFGAMTFYGGTALQGSDGVDYGSYLNINGAGGYASIAYNSLIDGGGFTIEFWMRSIADHYDSQYLLQKGGDDGDNYVLFRTLWDTSNDGSIRAWAYDTAGSSNVITDTNELSHNEWHHVALIVGEQYLAYYLDAELIYDGDCYPDTRTTGTYDLIIGDPSQDVELHIDEFKVFDGLRDQGEIQAEYSIYRPTAVISVSSEYINQYEQVTFDASSSYGGTPNYDYDLDFGDGTSISSTSGVFYYSYSTSGTYTAKLTVTDYLGYTDEEEVTIYVDPEDNWESNNNYWEAAFLGDVSSDYPFDQCGLYQNDDDWYEFNLISNDNTTTVQVYLYDASTYNWLGIEICDYEGNTIVSTIKPTGKMNSEVLTAELNGGENYKVKIYGEEGYGSQYCLRISIDIGNKSGNGIPTIPGFPMSITLLTVISTIGYILSKKRKLT